MRILLMAIILILTGFNKSAFAQHVLTTSDLAEDIIAYKDTISTKHKNAFVNISKYEFDNRIDILLQKLPSLTKEEVTIELLKINAFIGDEHTNIFPLFNIEMPLQFKLFDEGVAIIAADSLNKKYLLYRIASIEKVPFHEIIGQFKTIIKQDNPSFFKYFVIHFMNKPEILKGLGIIKNENNLAVQLVSLQGDTVDTYIRSQSINSKNKWIYAGPFQNLLAYKESNAYWFHYDQPNNALYFNYRQCKEMEAEPFQIFNKRMFEKIKETKPNKLILDLRSNSGGNSAILKPFIKSIQKSYLNKKGHLFVLIGKNVASSAVTNAVELKRTTHAIFVGESTGGNINHFGEVRYYTLPHTKSYVTYSTKYWENWKNHNGPLHPDIVTTNSLSDFVKSSDKTIEMILLPDKLK